MDDIVTIKFLYGGLFGKDESGVVYNGILSMTADVNIDEFSWFTIVEEAEKCGCYKKDVDAIFFMNPGVGLKRVVDDLGTQVMCKVGVENRGVEVFLVSGVDVPKLMRLIEDSVSEGTGPSLNKSWKKLTPRRKAEVQVCPSKLQGPPPKTSTSNQSRSNKKDSKTSFIGIKVPLKDSLPNEILNHKTQLTVQAKIGQTRKNYNKKDNKTSEVCIKEPIPQLHKQKPLQKTQKLSQDSTVVQIKSPRFTPKDYYQSTPTDFQSTTFEPPGYDFNDITLADCFDSFEEAADIACLNSVKLDSDVGESDDPWYDPVCDDDTISDDQLSEVELVDERVISDNEVDENWLEQEELVYDDNSDNDELNKAREKVKEWNARARRIDTQLEAEVGSKLAEVGSIGSKLLTGQESVVSGRTEPAGTAANEVANSDYDGSDDELDTPNEDEDDPIPGKRKKSSVPVVNEHCDFAKLKWCVGIKFPSREFFRDCVTRYSIAQGRNCTFVVSDKSKGRKLGVKCKEGCPFTLYGSWDNSQACFLIKSVKANHTCQRTMERNRQLKSTWLAKQFIDVFKAKPHWPAADIIESVRKAYKIIVKKNFAYKVKYYAHKLLHGSMNEHYSKLGRYLSVLEQEYPNNTFTLCTKPHVRGPVPVFFRLFICFDALKQGWLEGCRKLLCVDACFLKTFLGGQLISAIGRDANDQMFPLAWAVVEGENNDSYKWFFQQLKAALGEEDGEGWTFISDEHQSIISMVAQEFPRAEHRRCARHIFANWHKSYKGDEMKVMFWNCAHAYNQADFDDAMAAMKEVDPRAVEAFMRCNPTVFCRAFISTRTVNNVVVNNMAETFNAWIINARSKHLIDMLEDIRSSLMQRLVAKKKEMELVGGPICPVIQEKLEKEKDKAANCQALPSSSTLYQVDGEKVNIAERTCTCRKWDVTGVPCNHAVAAIFDMHAVAEDFVHEVYRKETYLRAYNFSISPCPGERHWPKVDAPLIPPPIKVGPGRPRKKRRRDPHENPNRRGKLTKHGLQMTCSLCKSKEHNKRKCPNVGSGPSVSKPAPKRGRGRPRSLNTPDTNMVQLQPESTAQPSRLGKGGRVITMGGPRAATRGSTRGRGGARNGSRGGGRAPRGFGILFDDQGHAFTNSSGAPVRIDQPGTQSQSSSQPTHKSQATICDL